MKKSLAVLTAATISLSVLSPFASNANASQVTSPTIEVSQVGDVETNGVKKWIAEKAMRAVASTLRSGGKLVDDIIEDLGGAEAKAFSKNTDVIADALDDLADRGEVVEDAIIDTISTALISAGVPSGTARTIAAVFAFLAF